jgi:hypothetical protein
MTYACRTLYAWEAGSLTNTWPLGSFKPEPKVCAKLNVVRTPVKLAKSCQVQYMNFKVTTYKSYTVAVSFQEGQENFLANRTTIKQICDRRHLVSYLAFPERSSLVINSYG